MPLQTTQPLCLPSLKILSDYWTLRILDALSVSSLRFCELQRTLEGINTATLTKRLKMMEDDGLILRQQRSRAAVMYTLSGLGGRALPLLEAVNDFSAYAAQHTKPSK